MIKVLKKHHDEFMEHMSKADSRHKELEHNIWAECMLIIAERFLINHTNYKGKIRTNNEANIALNYYIENKPKEETKC